MSEKLFIGKQLRGVLFDGFNKDEVADYLKSYGIGTTLQDLELCTGDVVTVNRGTPIVIDYTIVKALFIPANDSACYDS